MALDTIDLDNLTVDDLSALIKRARELKSKKSTPSIKINAYVTSVGKHVEGALQAIKKLADSQGVPERKWEDIEAHLRRLQLDTFREEAQKVKITPRAPRGTRKRR